MHDVRVTQIKFYNDTKKFISDCLLVTHLTKTRTVLLKHSDHFLLLMLLASLIFTEMLWLDNP